MSLAQRSIRSVTWNTLASLIAIPVTFVQSILLARLLPVEDFGIFAGVASILAFSSVVFHFGLDNAFMHRSEQTRDENFAAGIYFSLRLISVALWLGLMIASALVFFSGTRQWVMVVLALTYSVTYLLAVPKILLVRRVEHKRLALIDLATSLSTALISVLIAYYYHSIWALLVGALMTLVNTFIGLHLIQPVERPRPRWDPPAVRYFLSFGFKNLTINLLDSAIENLDNLWTNLFLGDRWLGYYSRAYRFAIYPRAILTVPMNMVSLGMFAELKYDRLRLSKAFFRVSFLLTSLGAYISGLFLVIAPLFITIFLGPRWLPMLGAFRLLLLFLFLDPLRVITSSLLVGVGQPERVTRIRLVQLVLMAAGLFTLGLRYQIGGVALAIDLMTLVGAALSLRAVRRFVDFSWPRLFAPQIGSFLAGLALNLLIFRLFAPPQSDLLELILRALIFSLGYGLAMGLLEGRTLVQSLFQIARVYPPLADLLRRLQMQAGEPE